MKKSRLFGQHFLERHLSTSLNSLQDWQKLWLNQLKLPLLIDLRIGWVSGRYWRAWRIFWTTSTVGRLSLELYSWYFHIDRGTCGKMAPVPLVTWGRNEKHVFQLVSRRSDHLLHKQRHDGLRHHLQVECVLPGDLSGVWTFRYVSVDRYRLLSSSVRFTSAFPRTVNWIPFQTRLESLFHCNLVGWVMPLPLMFCLLVVWMWTVQVILSPAE